MCHPVLYARAYIADVFWIFEYCSAYWSFKRGFDCLGISVLSLPDFSTDCLKNQ